MRVALLHGFNVRDGGEATLGAWESCLRTAGHDAQLFDYGWVGPIRVRLENMDVVDRLADWRPEVIIGHSNGATIAWRYAQTGAPLAGVVAVQPALHTKARWPSNVKRIACLYNPGDWAVYAGKLWRLLNPVSWFVRHPWGAAGRYGFKHTDRRFSQYNTARDPLFPYRGHSISQLSTAGARYWAMYSLGDVLVGSFRQSTNEVSHATTA